MTDYSEPLPYYRWFWRDFRASRAVQDMSWQARGLYRELLDECWVAGSIPDGTDPDTHATLARICGTTPDIIATWWAQLRPHFRKRGRKLINPRIEREREHAAQMHEAKSDAGKRGAEKRWSEKNGGAIADPKQSMASSSSAVQMQSISSTGRSERLRGKPRAPTPVGEVLDWRAILAANGVPPVEKKPA